MKNKTLYPEDFSLKRVVMLFLMLTLIFIVSCKNEIANKTQHELAHSAEGNIFKDEILQNICNLQNEHDIQQLLKYLNNEYPEYRKAGVLAFASIQDSSVILTLSTLFEDVDEDVREAVAYTLGQIGCVSAEQILLDVFEIEKSATVKKEILEAIGKCGTEKGLIFISSLNISVDDLVLLSGQAWGLTRFALRGYSSVQSTQKALDIISNKDMPENVRFIISHYFARIKGIDLSNYHTELVNAFKKEGYVYTKINLATSFGNSTSVYSLDFLHKILEDDYDYRIKVNAIRACEKFDYKDSKQIIFTLLEDEIINIAITASEFFVDKGIAEDANLYYEESMKLSSWQTRANLLKAALIYADEKKSISNSIISGYQVTENIYEKASLLKALEGDPSQYKFVEEETFFSDEKIISTAGIETLIAMRKNSDFEKYNKIIIDETGDNLYEEFSLIFKKAIQSQDVALITLAADILQDTSMNFIDEYENTYFLTQALHNCQLPRDIEAYLELADAIEFINGAKISTLDKIEYNPIDWNIVTSISSEQKAIIKTTKGDITLKLDVNNAPVAVANFVKLVKESYYNGSIFHRVVPNFVIQDGCIRGDGWGSENYTIRSEFSPSYFEEGSVGMASAGKDTESVQWFITQYPTANLDGKYTLFGIVIDGLEIIHEIEIGDQIISIEIL
jgi:cyclophilin family peptidyl-prolyl cis-trans isomerase